MFGSRKEPKLMDGRHVIWSAQSDGMPLLEALADFIQVVGKYNGPFSELMIGYWEYGGEIVVTAPNGRSGG